MCGEHPIRSCYATHIQGSSPRVRGTLVSSWSNALWSGIIPACAGNTSMRGRPMVSSRDHPRVCGEHKTLGGVVKGVTGSSPRVRGTPIGQQAVTAPVGIIPACAGNTCRSSPARSRMGDHPRVCGEHAPFARIAMVPTGSSPRVRGTHVFFFPQ